MDIDSLIDSDRWIRAEGDEAPLTLNLLFKSDFPPAADRE